jgi:arginine decarboxylase
MLAINRWNETYERVLLGGLTCDSDDYYNLSKKYECHLLKYNKETIVYWFFQYGAYQKH